MKTSYYGALGPLPLLISFETHLQGVGVSSEQNFYSLLSTLQARFSQLVKDVGAEGLTLETQVTDTVPQSLF